MALESVKKSGFWKRKFHTAAITRDVDKDGFISRADLESIIQHYKSAGSPPEHVKKLQGSSQKYYEAWGMADETKKVTIEEFEEKFRETLEISFPHADEMCSSLFEQVDMNADGSISFEEWQIHNAALGISTEHAKKSFEAIDANGDGKVSFEEFKAFYIEFFYSAEDKLGSSTLYGPLI